MKNFLPSLFKNTQTVEQWLSGINSMMLDAERAFEEMDRAFPVGLRNVTFPPVDIVKTGTGYKVSLAVAGFKRDELAVEVGPNMLTVTGKKETKSEDAYLVKSIATRQFVRKWQLLDQDEVEGVKLEDGLLTIAIKRNEPTPVEDTVKRLEIK